MANFRYIENLYLAEELPDPHTGIDELENEIFAADTPGPAFVGGTRISVRQWVSGVVTNGILPLSLVGVLPNSLLILVIGISSDTAATTPNPDSVTDNASLPSWTKRQDAQGLTTSNMEVYSNIYTVGGNITVTTDWNSQPGENIAGTLFEITGAETLFGGSYPTPLINQIGPASQNITTTRNDSIIFLAYGDWNAANGAGHLYTTEIQETEYYFAGGVMTQYIGFKYIPVIGTWNLGIKNIAQAGANVSVITFEIRNVLAVSGGPFSQFFWN